MTLLPATSLKRSRLVSLLLAVSHRLSRSLARSDAKRAAFGRTAFGDEQTRAMVAEPNSSPSPLQPPPSPSPLQSTPSPNPSPEFSQPAPSPTPPPSALPDEFHGFDALFAETDLDVQAVSRLLLAETSDLVSPIPQVVRHIVSSGGKRLRARLVIASARLLGYRGDGAGHRGGGDIALGAAIEAIHCASLLHDDVVDGSKMRRGLPVANFLWGAQASVLVGDFLFARAFALMCREKNFEILELLSRTAVRLTQGEVRQLYNARALSMPASECLDIIMDKTATLFRAATMSGALLARATDAQQRALARFGEKFGVGYQLADDMLDYVAQHRSLGKQRGDDLRDGKITYPLILCVARASKKERKRIQRLFANKACGDAQVEEVLEIMRRYDCLADCSELANAHLLQSAEAIEGLGDGRLRAIMQQACLASINRSS